MSQKAAQDLQRFDLRALHDTSQFLSSSLDREFVLSNLLLTAMSKLLVTRGAVWLYKEEAGIFELAAQKGCADIVGKCDSIVIQEDLQGVVTGSDVPEILTSSKIVLAAPIRFSKRLIGLIGFGKKATGVEFSTGEVEFVKSLVNMSSSAVHNSLVVDELRTANRNLDSKVQQVNTLFDLSKEFNATVDRVRHARLLSLALMGQMMASKHIFLVSRSDDSLSTKLLHIVSCSGFDESVASEELIEKICAIEVGSGITGLYADQNQWMAGTGIDLIIPFVQQGVTTGALFLGPRMSRQSYTSGDIEFIYALGNLALTAVQNSFLIEEQIEKEILEEEMRLARTIQENLQPKSLPSLDGVDLAMLALPSRHVAGDYVDVVELTGDRLLLAIGDVTGKGMPASLLMSNLQAALHVLIPMDITLEQTTSHINRVISRNTDFDKFITYFHCIYTAADRGLKYVNAGHNPPYVVHSDGKVDELEEGGLLLGVMSGADYALGSVTLDPGDVVAMFTDGVTEAMSPEEEEYGEERLIEVLKDHRGGSAQDILDAVHQAIIAFTGSETMLSDDLTMVVMKVT